MTISVEAPRPIRGRDPKPSAPLRLDKIGQLQDIFSYLAEKRGVTTKYFTDNKSRRGRTGKERSSVFQELIEWNQGVPIGATDEEVGAVIKRDRTTVVINRKIVKQKEEKEALRTTVLRALDKLTEEQD